MCQFLVYSIVIQYFCRLYSIIGYYKIMAIIPCAIQYILFFLNLFLAVLGLHCCARAFSSCSEWRLLFVAVCGLLIAVASLCCRALALGVQASVVVACGLQQLWLTGSRAQAQQLQRTGLVVLWHVGSSQTRVRTCVPCVGRWILFFFFNKFIHLFIFGCVGSSLLHAGFPQLRREGLLFVAVHRLLIEVASLVAEHGFQARGLQQLWHVGSVVVACGLQSAGSVVVAHGPSCSTACGIFPDQGLNLCPLNCQEDS